MSKEYLPGDPSNLLVRKVRRHLKSYGIVPHVKYWRLAWTWAAKVASSYQWSDRCINGQAKALGMKEFMPRRPRWPSPSEIGCQYVILMLAEMRDMHALKLPYRAHDEMPEAVSIAQAVPMPTLGTGKKPAPRQLAAADLFTEAVS